MITTGVFTLDPWTILEDSSMKTELLYFDHLKYFISGKETIEKFCKTIPNGKESFDRRMKELEELEKVGLISEYSKAQYNIDSRKHFDEKILEQTKQSFNLTRGFTTKDKEFKEVFIDFLERFREVGQYEARINAILLNKVNKDEFVPIIRGNYYNFVEDPSLKKATVLSVVINNFPRVQPDISSEKLIDLKGDEEAKIKLQRLKHWAIDMANSKLTEKEINQKIEYLLLEYQRHLDLHKIKYEMGIVETLVIVGLEVFENIVKLNLSKAAKVFFDLHKKEMALSEEEEKLIGKEVAYLHHLNKSNL